MVKKVKEREARGAERALKVKWRWSGGGGGEGGRWVARAHARQTCSEDW